MITTLVFVAASQLCMAGGMKEFNRLERKLEALTEEHTKTVEAMKQRYPDFDPTGTDASKLPPDGRIEVLKQMDALIDGSPEHPDVTQMALTALHWSIRCGDRNSPVRFAAYAKPLADFSDIEEELEALEYYYTEAGDPDVWIEAFQEFSGLAKKRKVKRAARLAAAKVRMDTGRLDEAKRIFKTIAREAPYADSAKRAKGFVFEIEHLQIGMVAPDFHATTIDDKKVSLRSLRGKVVLITFWATSCPSCTEEVPRLKEAASRFGDELVILGVSCDESRSALKNTIKAQQLPGTHTWDRKDGENPIAKLYNMRGFPTWYLLDTEGVIRARNPLGVELMPAVVRTLSRSAPGKSDG